MNTKDIKIKDILQWIVENKDDYEAITDINRTSYAFMQKGRGVY